MTTKLTTETLVQEAGRKLQAHIQTGLAGFRQQATDRLAALGIRVPAEMTSEDLVRFLGINWGFRG